MPNSFQRATENFEAFARDLVEKNHVELYEVDVKIDYVFTFRDPEAEAPAIMVRGHRVLGQARINPLKHRVLGLGDCEVLLDGDAWQDMPVETQKALVDHELEHFEVKRHPKTGAFLYDDAGRPQMKLRDHDYEFGFFGNIARRYGANSIEVQNLRRMFLHDGDSFIPGLTQTPEIAAPGESDSEEENTVTISSGDVTVTTSGGALRRLAEKLKNLP